MTYRDISSTFLEIESYRLGNREGRRKCHRILKRMILDYQTESGREISK